MNQHGYICKTCGGVAPMGVGFVSDEPAAVRYSPTIERCACGASVAPRVQEAERAALRSLALDAIMDAARIARGKDENYHATDRKIAQLLADPALYGAPEGADRLHELQAIRRQQTTARIDAWNDLVMTVRTTLDSLT